MVACPCSACGCSIDGLLSFSLSPHIAEILASNELPSDTERVAISDENGHLRTRIAELNTHISQAEASLKQLKTAKAALEAHLAARAHILSPISTLPTDILCEIFARCAEPDDLPTASGHFAFEEKAPWLLATVSRRWRTTAIAFSQLWSHIAIRLRIPHDLRYNRLVLRLQRSQQNPLYLYLMSSSVSLQKFPDIIRVLSETSHRWKHLSLCGPLPLLQSLFIQELPLPLLQAIHINVCGVPVNISSSVFRNASSLAHLTVPADVLLHSEWPVSQITACTILEVQRGIPNSTVCGVIRQFTRLRVLDLTYRRWSLISEDEPHESPIILPSLTKLTLGLCGSGDQMLEALLLPNLTCLCLEGYLNSTAVFQIHSLHARSNFDLSKLTLGDMTNLTSDNVFHLLEAFPRIFELCFRHSYRNTETILTRLAEETTMIPNLKVLILSNYIPISEKCLLVLANSRPNIYVEF